MSIIQSVRSYFDTTIKTIDSDFKSDGFVFDTEFTADHNLDFTYKLNIGTMSIVRQDSDIEATIPVEATIYRVSNADKQKDDFDNTYCKAIDIAALASNQTRVSQTDYMKSVVATGIEPLPLVNNDNSMQFRISFNVTVIFKYLIQ